MIKLCNCAYCGSEKVNLITKIHSRNFKEYFVRCENCYATGGREATEDEAATNWNRLNVVQSDFEKFVDMLNNSEFNYTYKRKDSTINYEGDEINTKNIVIPDDETNKSGIEAIFLGSTEEFIGLRTCKMKG